MKTYGQRSQLGKALKSFLYFAIMKVKIGLIGFGKTGKAVASVILQNKEFSLEWVFRRTTVLENRSVPAHIKDIQ